MWNSSSYQPEFAYTGGVAGFSDGSFYPTTEYPAVEGGYYEEPVGDAGVTVDATTDLDQLEGKWIERLYLPVESAAVTALTFDGFEDRVWLGGDDGRLTSHSMLDLSLLTAVQAHTTEIVQLLPCYNGVVSVGYDSARVYNRGGLVLSEIVATHLPPSPGKQADIQPSILCALGLSHIATSNTLPPEARLAVATDSGGVHMFDLTSPTASVGARRPPKPLASLELTHDVGLMRANHRIMVAASGAGDSISLCDPLFRSGGGKALGRLSGHNGGILDMDVSGEVLVTCGLIRRSDGSTINDMAVKVFDLRMMRLLTSSTMHGPNVVFTRFSPRNSQLFLGTHSGSFKLCDVTGSTISPEFSDYFMCPTPGAITSCDLALSGDLLGCSDGLGVVHFFASSSSAACNAYSAPHSLPHVGPFIGPNAIKSEAADVVAQPAKDVSAAFIECSFVSAPPFDAALDSQGPPVRASALPSWMKHYKMKPILQKMIDPVLAAKGTIHDNIRYIPNPGFKMNTMLFGKGFSEGLTSPWLDCDPRNQDGDDAEGMMLTDSFDMLISNLPVAYQRPHLKLPRLGIFEFDFSLYNTTEFAGLEDVGPNGLVNSLLQLLFFEHRLRDVVSTHLCPSVGCLVCELRFLFDILAQSSAIPPKTRCTRPQNFVRTLSSVQEAVALRIVHPTDSPPMQRMANLFRFMMERMTKEFATPDGGATREQQIVQSVYATDFTVSITCSVGHTQPRNVPNFLINLEYPSKHELTEQGRRKSDGGRPTFASMLQSSLATSAHHKGYCTDCKDFKPLSQRKVATGFPEMLALNVSAFEKEHRKVWRCVEEGDVSEWIPAWLHVGNVASTGGTHVSVADASGCPTEFVPPSAARIGTPSEGLPEVLYALVGVIWHIDDPSVKREKADDPNTHFVAALKVGGDGSFVLPSPTDVPTPQSDDWTGPTSSPTPVNNWAVFNDFRISFTSEVDCRNTNVDWRTPCVLLYAAVRRNRASYTVTAARCADPSGFMTMPSLTVHSVDNSVFTWPFARPNQPLLKPTAHRSILKFPGRGDIIAIDAEFVSVATQEDEVLPDGTRVILKSSRQAPGRVTVISDSGAILMDDYVEVPETIVDYLTRFSGLSRGDLDPATATKPIYKLKEVYCKLRALVDSGCTWVGHGVANDFRILNLHVPASQVVDTVELFRLPQQRIISLRFLAAYLLKADIQSSVHDSFEDARTALRLYQKYQQLKRDGALESTLQQLYADGRAMGWKVGATLGSGSG